MHCEFMTFSTLLTGKDYLTVNCKIQDLSWILKNFIDLIHQQLLFIILILTFQFLDFGEEHIETQIFQKSIQGQCLY